MKPVHVKAKVVTHNPCGAAFRKLVLAAGAVAAQARPGQFVMLHVHQALEPLLRRPFSIHRVQGTRIEILYEVVGTGTEILARKKPGNRLDLLGPLGNAFDARLPSAACRQPIIVAGGIGVAPLVFLAQKIKKHNGLVLIGARSAGQILCEKEFQKAGFSVKIATDDGSRGFGGRVTELLENTLSAIDYRLSTIYACGPHPMIREVARLSRKYKIPAQVSLEAHMACGIGACLGCVVNTKDGYKRVCKEGPVFDIEELVW